LLTYFRLWQGINQRSDMLAYTLIVFMVMLVKLKVRFVIFDSVDCSDETCRHFLFIENSNNNTKSIYGRNEQIDRENR